MMNMNKSLIVIVGPTAIGKTKASIRLANHFNCEIVSADSRQFYKEMSIGTAAPTSKELSQAHHHFIQHISINTSYSVGDFEKDALQKIETLFLKNDYAILIGGSGLYVDAVIKGLDQFPEVDPTIRQKLKNDLDTHGIENLQKQLNQVDPVYYNQVDIQNTHRVMRALEVSLSSNLPYSSFRTKPKKERPFNIITIGLQAERSIIYDRINYRVDKMMEEGLLEEAKTLYKYKNLNALNTVGYKELFNVFDKEWDLDFAISEIKKNTRRFAKRQLTWFRKNKEIQWFDYLEDPKTIVDYIETKQLSSKNKPS